MSVELATVLQNNTFYRKKIIHDCVSDGTDNQSLTALIPQDLTCNCLGFEYKSTDTEIWDGTKISNGSLDTTITAKYGFALTSAQNDKVCTVKIYIPDPGGDIKVDEFDINIDSKNNATKESYIAELYVGPEALQYGFKIKLTSDYAMTVSEKSIMVYE